MAKTTSTPAPLPQIKAAQLRTFHARLLAWYGDHGRHALPWRKTDDAYAIWISEVMLQQTQVATVLARYYHPFLERFPTVQHLARAPREAVLKAWEGLGYYRRAGYVHEAARRAHNGMPRDVEGLRSLPGIGKNTAHAIAAFAYHEPVAILEANVKRIVARIFALETPKEDTLWQGAELLLNRKHPFDHNQAMMDLGSLICTPKAPQCPICPANKICLGQTNPTAYPAPKVRKQVPTREVVMDVREDAAGRLYLETRSDALLGGLYGFPQTPLPSFLRRQESLVPHPLRIKEETAIPACTGMTDKKGAAELGTVTHTYSHFKLIGHVMHTHVIKQKGPGWFTRAEIDALPLSRVDHKVLALIDNSHSAPKKRKIAKAPRAKR